MACRRHVKLDWFVDICFSWYFASVGRASSSTRSFGTSRDCFKLAVSKVSYLKSTSVPTYLHDFCVDEC